MQLRSRAAKLSPVGLLVLERRKPELRAHKEDGMTAGNNSRLSGPRRSYVPGARPPPRQTSPGEH